MSRRFRSLRRQILTGYMVLVLIIAAVGTWSIYNFVHLARLLTDITRENYVSVLAAENMIGAIERQDSAELLLLLGEVRGAVDIYQIGHRDFIAWLDTEENNITLPNEGDVARYIKERYQEYDALFSKMHDLAVQGNPTGARQVYLAQAEPAFKAIREDLQRLLEMNHQALMDGNERSKAAARRATISTAAFGISAVLVGVFLGLGVSASVVHPTLALTAAIRRIREAHLDEVVDVRSADEIGELAAEFNRMVSRLREYEEAMAGKVVAEQRKALTVITAMDEAAILIDENRGITMINPSAASLFQVERDAAIGLDAFELIRRFDVAGMIAKALSEGVTPHNRMVTMREGDEERFYEVEVVPVTQEGKSTPSGAVVIFKDVTYFARLEKMKSDFLSDVSHEIRTPLTSIAMGVGMLRESRSLAGMQRECAVLEMVEEETNRLIGLVNELLELSKLESGRVELKLQDVPFRAVVDRAVAPFVSQAESNGVHLELSVDEDLPTCCVDVDRMISVIANLFTNALRYTPRGGSIGLRAAKGPGEIVVSVTDTGPGIPVALREKIFDRFYQVKERPGGAAGLGLPISKAIVKAHGGDMWVEGEEGKGSTFVFTVPLKAGGATEPSEPSGSNSAVGDTGSGQGTKQKGGRWW